MYPRVLIVSDNCFNDYQAGGITMSNLFSQWPSEQIAIASSNLKISDCEKCRPCSQYFSFNDKKVKNLLINNAVQKEKKITTKTKVKSSIIEAIRYLYTKLGIKDLMPEKRLTNEFLSFVKTFNPDVIFSTTGNLHELNFAVKISQTIEIPLAIHIWDDWPANPGLNQRWFGKLWKRVYKNAFTKALDVSAINFSICDKMSRVYEERYNKKFYAFHNPVDISEWDIYPNQDDESGKIMILYLGKIMKSTETAVFEMCEAVDKLARNGEKVSFVIYSRDCTPTRKMQIEKYQGCTLNFSDLDKSDIPRLMKSMSMLYLPLSFEESSANYSRLSMLTKVTEYLVSKVPILLYAPEDSAVYEYLQENNCAYFASRGVDSLMSCIGSVISDTENRNRIIDNQYKLVVLKHQKKDVSNSLKDLLNTIKH